MAERGNFPFHTLFPEIGERETRMVRVLASGHEPESVGFLEHFWTRERCDCRRRELFKD
jgi:hypothetical protein